MRKPIFLAAVPALLLSGALQAQAPEPSSQPPANAQSSPSDTGSKETGPPVGTPPSNVDEKATSGSYYPYSAGTVGDDPAKPHATEVPDGDGPIDRAASESERWMAADADRNETLSKDEFERAWPTLGARFDEIDVDHDKKLTRDELRTWHTSQKARMDADQPARTPTTGTEPAPASTTGTEPAPATTTGDAPAATPATPPDR